MVPFGLLRHDEMARLRSLIEPLSGAELHETIESNGQFTLQLLPFSAPRATVATTVCSRRLLLVFVDALLAQTATSIDVNRTLCHIVLQRFLSRVTTSSEVVNAVMARIRGEADAAPPPPHKKARAMATPPGTVRSASVRRTFSVQ